MTKKNTSMTTAQLLDATLLSVEDKLELEQIRAFYGIHGMVANFLTEYHDAPHTRRQVDYGIEKNRWRGGVLRDARAYMLKHKKGFEDLLPILKK